MARCYRCNDRKERILYDKTGRREYLVPCVCVTADLVARVSALEAQVAAQVPAITPTGGPKCPQ